MKRTKQLNAPVLSIKELTEGKETGIMGKLGEIIEETNQQGELTPRFFQLKVHGGPINPSGADGAGYETFWFDGGIKGAFKLAKVKPGAMIEILFKGQKAVTLDNGEKVNVNLYDLFDVA